ncbi:MAG: ExbD/TolR family protein [Planctomycetota bacterium]
MRRTSEAGPELEIDMSPMIDIVFNLLIFFICATKFRTAEGAIEAFLPKDRGLGGQPTEVKLTEVRVLLAWHDRDGRPTRADEGHVVVKVGGETLSEREDFPRGAEPSSSPAWARLQRRLGELKALHRGPDPLPVILDVRPQVPTQYAISALNEVVRAGLKEVAFAAPER